MAKGSKTRTVEVRAVLPKSDEAKQVSLAAYAFSAGGRLLDVKGLDKNGEGALEVPLGSEGMQVRVLVGPQLDKDKIGLEELVRRGALQQRARLDLEAVRLPIQFVINLPDILCWLRGLCVVQGSLLKRSVLGGQNVDLPVCHAEIEIYEVDPLWIILPKLPDLEFNRVRDWLVNPVPLPDPVPEPLPGPFPGPFPDPLPPVASRLPVARKVGGATTLSARMSMTAASTASLSVPSELQSAALSGSRLQLEAAIIRYPDFIRPILCWFFPRFVTMQLVATTTTDDCGKFHTIFSNGCNNPDTPDLYFKAYRKLFPWLRIPIYAPTPVWCYTWWNYVCGSDVTLHTTHPFALTCPPCPPVIAGTDWVLFTAIGGLSMNSIYGSSQALAGSTTSTNKGLTKGGAPFGGSLRPQLLFDNSLRDTLGVKYYKLHYRRGTSGSWIQMLDDVQRHYSYDVGPTLVSALYKLGPLSPPDAPAANLYEIPPSLPPQGVWGPVVWPTDHQNGVFNTTIPSPGITYDAAGNEVGVDQSGKFEIMLELFDSAGNPVNIGALGIKYYVPNVDDLTGTITTVDAATLGLVVGNQMIVTVHVDNNPTYSEIDAPSIGAATADPCCGVLTFNPGDMVTLPWRSKHKNGFATYDLTVKRVDAVVYSENDQPVGSGTHSVTRSAQGAMDFNLPAGCLPGGCETGAFAAELYTAAMATDGWSSRLTYLDSSDFEAFTLKKA
ncbi:MAG: hypothetical protein U0132_19640 [Gemmatimonadaceae bacterium]